jgi:hypothetical protein
MIKFIYGFVLISFISVSFVSAQSKSIEHVNQVWTGYLNQTRLNKKWGIWFDAHLRTKEDIVNGLSQAIIRPGLTYYLNDDVKLTAGYSFINHFPAENHKNISMPEHRPWVQVQWHNRYPSLRLMQWVRFEERFRHKILNNDALADGYNSNFRMRVNLLLQYSLSKKKFAPGTFSFATGSELMVNLGKKIVYNTFDQNRFFIGFHYHVNKHDYLQFGYMNLFQQLSTGNQFKSINTGRIFYFHNIDLRK